MAALPIPALAAINHVLGQADWAREKLAVFAGRSARVVMPPFDANIVVLDNGFLSSPTDDKAEADVTINLPASAPLLLLQGLPVLMRAVKLSGSVDFAEALSFVIRNLKWDVEEDLSKVVGDIAAHRLVDGAKRFGTWNAGVAQISLETSPNISPKKILSSPNAPHSVIFHAKSTACATMWRDWKSV